MAVRMKRVSVELVLNLENPLDVRLHEVLKPMMLDPRPGMANLRVGKFVLEALHGYLEPKDSQSHSGNEAVAEETL